MQRLFMLAAWFSGTIATILFAWGLLAGSFPAVQAQTGLTFAALAIALGLTSLYLRDPRPTQGRFVTGLSFITASQLVFIVLVWTDLKQESFAWRIWWAAAVPSLVAAHLRVLRLFGQEWDTRFGRYAWWAICGHGALWISLVLRRDLLSDPPVFMMVLIAIAALASAVATWVPFDRWRKSERGFQAKTPGWARFAAFAGIQILLFLSGVYVGRAGSSHVALDEMFPSALAGIPLEELEVQAKADLARLRRMSDEMDSVVERSGPIRTALAAAMAAEKRTYLRPAEDDKVRALFLSFMSCRSGLLRFAAVYSGFEAVRDPDLKARCFLIAYAATTLMNEAGVRLVSGFSGDDLIRRKLNEPDPGWGVPAGMFDRIAESVTSSRLGERFEEMAAYYESRAPLWREQELLPAADMAWMDDRVKRGVSAVRALTPNRSMAWVKRLLSKVKSDAYSPVYAMQTQLSVMIGDTRIVTRAPLISHEQIHELGAKLEPGDIIIERRNFFLSNAFLPGFWPHAVFYIGTEEDLVRLGIADSPEVRAKLEEYRRPSEDGERHAVIEAVSEGVIFNSLQHSLHADFVAVLRPRVSLEKKAEAIRRAFSHEGKPYDFEFDFFTSDKLVCTEVVYRSYEGTLHFDLQRVMGRDTLPALEIVKKFARERGREDRELDFVGFLDGKPEEGNAVWGTEDAFCESAKRPREFHE